MQRWAPGARVVKAFNSTSFENMAPPAYPGGAVAMFVCGDDAARDAVRGLARDVGFEAVPAGGLARARPLEPTALLWLCLAMADGVGRDFAFAVLRR